MIFDTTDVFFGQVCDDYYLHGRFVTGSNSNFDKLYLTHKLAYIVIFYICINVLLMSNI